MNPVPDPSGDSPDFIHTESPLSATVYLAIRLPAGTTPGGMTEVQQRLADAARKVTESGRQVRYLNGMYMPAQNRLLCVFAAESTKAVEDTAELIRLPFVRIDTIPGDWDPNPAPADEREPGG